jgi:CheY-like chemotaxis protein
MEQTPRNRRKLLVVDDELGLRHLMRFDFNSRGYLVDTVSSGEAALEKAQTEKFDLSLCDFRMPGINGVETLRGLKRLQPDMGVVMVTGYPSPESAEEALRAGAADYVAKPYNLDYLAYVFDQVVDTRQAIAQALSGLPPASQSAFGAEAREVLNMVHSFQVELSALQERNAGWDADRKACLVRILDWVHSLLKLCGKVSHGGPSDDETKEKAQDIAALTHSIGMELHGLREGAAPSSAFEKEVFGRLAVKAQYIIKLCGALCGSAI